MTGLLQESRFRRLLADGVVAGLAGAATGGVPSTVHALLTGRDPREATAAAGTIALPRVSQERRLLVGGTLVHAGVSTAWGLALALVLPRRRTARAGTVAGLLIAAVDLGLIGRRFDRIAGLPLLPQLADHVVYGATVGVALERRRIRIAARDAGRSRRTASARSTSSSAASPHRRPPAR